MAFLAPAVWEVRTTGSDANGGAFDPASGTPGTDYSQQDAAQVAYTDLVIGATTTQLTSVATPFTSAHVGNFINVTAGTGFTVQRLQILSVAASVATCDKSAGTAASTGGTGNLGGALATPTKAVGLMVASNTTYIKKGTYTISAALVPPSGVSGSKTSLIGYNASRTDLNTVTDFSNFPTIQNNNTTNFLIDSATNIAIRNLICDGGAGGSVANLGIRLTSGSWIDNVKVLRWSTNQAFNLSNAQATRCWATQGSGDSCFVISSSATITNCFASASACKGFRVTSNCSLTNCIASSLTGGSGIGFSIESGLCLISSCASYNNSQDGIKIAAVSGDSTTIQNTILSNNSGYGINSVTNYLQINENYNAFYSNTAGARNNVPVGANDVTLTAGPFTNAGSSDFSLNNTAGGGAACRAAGFPGAFPGGTTTGYLDIGAVQHSDPAKPDAVFINPGWNL